jgi:hypothetical protein
MIYYLSIVDGLPTIIHTDKEKALKTSDDIREFELENSDNSEYIYILCKYNEYLFFNNLFDAINFGFVDYENIYCITINNDFQEHEIYDINKIKELPLLTISSLELQYRIYNNFNKEDAFKEAYSMWKLFNYIEIINKLCEKYPNYNEFFKEHLKQAEILNKKLYSNREEFIDNVYSNKNY